jgi:hypothetical protein
MPLPRIRRLAPLLAVAVVSAAVGVAGGVAWSDGDASGGHAASVAKRAAKPSPHGAGRMRVRWRNLGGSTAALARQVRASGLAQQTASAVNESLYLPRDVTIVFGGDDDGPYYDPDSRTIQYPWSFVRETQDLLRASDYREGAELRTAVIDATRFSLQHEVAHALIDQLHVPIVGREEDAADSFAAFVAVEVDDDGEQVLAATDLFAALDDEDGHDDESAFWDEHSLDLQRYYEISCLVYGSDTKRYASLVDGLHIGADRLAACPDEWDATRDAWYRLLDAALRD